MLLESKEQEQIEKLLKKVSRSFYLNTMALRTPLKEYVTISYLLCRILDTIEDDPRLSFNEKIYGINLFLSLLWTTKLKGNAFSLWNGLCKKIQASKDEKEVMSNFELVLRIFSSFPSPNRLIIKKHVKIMALGMKKYLKKSPEDKLVIKDFKELDAYCYYVAGTVGELLSKIFTKNSKFFTLEQIKLVRKNSIAFGLGLQYVNIIKDLNKDLKRKIVYYPDILFKKYDLSPRALFKSENLVISKKIIDEMIKKTLPNLEKALIYTLNIPKKENSIRLFCLWPLFFAIFSLLEVSRKKDLLLAKKEVKISRRTVKIIIFITTIFSYSNLFLNLMFRISKNLILKNLASK